MGGEIVYIKHERITATSSVKGADTLDIPAEATHAELQADSSDIRYSMDGANDPTQSAGMILFNSGEERLFLIEDIKRIRFTRGTIYDGGLNVHYIAGRNV